MEEEFINAMIEIIEYVREEEKREVERASSSLSSMNIKEKLRWQMK